MLPDLTRFEFVMENSFIFAVFFSNKDLKQLIEAHTALISSHFDPSLLTMQYMDSNTTPTSESNAISRVFTLSKQIRFTLQNDIVHIYFILLKFVVSKRIFLFFF